MKKALLRFRDSLDRYRILPSYGEDTIFLLAVTVLIVLFLDMDARMFAEQVMVHSSKITLITLLGMGFAFYTAFFSYFKNEMQKFYMFWFALLVNFLSAFAVIGFLHTSDASPLYYLAPSLNIAIFVLMVVFWHADIIDTSAMPHKSSSFSNILYGTVVVVVLTLLSEYVLHTPWPAVFSFAIGYSTVFNQTITGVLPKIFSGRDQKISMFDMAVHKIINYMIENIGIENPYAASILTNEGIKDLNISPEYHCNIDTLFKDEARKLNRTNPVIAIASIGIYTSKRYWFSPTQQQAGFIVDVYPNDGTSGYQFFQMAAYDTEGVLKKHKGLIYLKKIPNIYVAT